MIAVEPAEARPAGSLPGLTFLLVAGYILYLCLCVAVEGAGRKACAVPTRAWIDAGADAHERALRQFRRVKAEECLNAKPWYSNTKGALFVVGVLAPFLPVFLCGRRVLRAVMKLPIAAAHAGAVAYSLIWLAGLAAMLYPYFGIEAFFDAQLGP